MSEDSTFDEAMIDSWDEETLSKAWIKASQEYIGETNRLVQIGLTEGWDNVAKDAFPKDTRQPMAKAVLEVVREANRRKDFGSLRKKFPPAHSPFYDFLEPNGMSLPMALLLDDGRILMRVGSPYERGRVALIEELTIHKLPPETITVGRSPNREYYAVASPFGVAIHQGWEGPCVANLPWPTGREGSCEEFECAPLEETPAITQLIPFNSGDQALLVSYSGVFVLRQNEAIRLVPTAEELYGDSEFQSEDSPGEPVSTGLSMEHGTISPDGKYIVAGHQCSEHLVFDSQTLKLVGEIGNTISYPHYALFSADSSILALNSCHFYNGETIGVPTELLPGLKTEPYEKDDRFVVLEPGARVYAGVARNNSFIIGDASGYLKSFDFKGNLLWQHFIGSTVDAIDLSRDGKQLIVTTYAGFLSILDLDTGEADPFVIGNGTNREKRRWLFWKLEKQPLAW